jgi:integrase
MNFKLKYVARERSGLLLYYRQIPADLRGFYPGKIHRRQSLRTHDPSAASMEAQRLAKIDDAVWQALRSGAPDIETALESLESMTDDRALIQKIMNARVGHRFSDALAIYLRKNRGREPRFAENARRVYGIAYDILGNRPLSEIKRTDGRIILETLLARGMKTSSVKRYLATLSAIFSAAILEYELSQRNPFSALEIPNFLEDAKDIPPFSADELHRIAEAGLAQRTEQSLIAVLQIETGARVREIAALRTDDISLDATGGHIEIRQHFEHGRRLKTGKAGERTLPLLGVSLAAGRLALEATDGPGWLFPRINKRNPSDSVNAWLGKILGGKPGSHSARRSVETRLVLEGIDQRKVDAILGHAPQAKMGSVYFSGFSLADLAEALGKIALR